MIAKTWRDIFELGGLLAIVLSLVFVAFQIRQDQLLTRSELGAGSAELVAQLSMTAIESGFQKTYVKMITQPDQLSDNEIVEAEFFLAALQQAIIRECYLVERGVFVECEVMVQSMLHNYFENEFAKNWWKQKSRDNRYLPDWIDPKFAELDADGNRRRLQELKEELQ